MPRAFEGKIDLDIRSSKPDWGAFLDLAADGSLTIGVQAEEPTDKKQRANWLPAPKSGEFSLYVRAYWPQTPVTDGSWTPPPVEKR